MQKFFYSRLPHVMCVFVFTPYLLALGLIPGFEAYARARIASGFHRGMALIFLLTACALIFRRFLGPRFGAGAPAGNERIASRYMDRDRQFFQAHLLPILAPIFCIAIFLYQSRFALFLPDLDFTGISEVLNLSRKGIGLLPAPHFPSGVGTSFLGHHFSPSLLLLVPIYWIPSVLDAVLLFLGVAEPLRIDHILYGWILVAIMAVAYIVWARYVCMRIRDNVLVLLACSALALNHYLLRFGLSFHFEAMALPFALLFFVGLERKRSILLWTGLLLWFGVKEDIAFYLLFFAAYLYFQPNYRQISIRIFVFSLLYIFFSQIFLRYYFAGGQGPSWNYWTDMQLRMPDLRVILSLLGSFAFLPLLRPGYFMLTLLPLIILQSLSGQSYHASFYGHYGYTVLPFLLYGFVLGLRRLETRLAGDAGLRLAAGFLIVSTVSYFAAGDRETPPILKKDPRKSDVAFLMRSIPAGSCLQAQSAFSHLAPLDLHVLPLRAPQGSSFQKVMIEFTQESSSPSNQNQATSLMNCKRLYLLLDVEKNDRLLQDSLIKEAMHFATEARVPLRQRGSVRLYGPFLHTSKKID